MKHLLKRTFVLATAAVAVSVQAQTASAPAAHAAAETKIAMGHGQISKVDTAGMSVTFTSGETLKVKDAVLLKGLKDGVRVEFKADMTADGPVITTMKVPG